MGQNDDIREAENPYASPRSMLDDVAEGISGDGSVEDLRPFRTIWTRPRETVRKIDTVQESGTGRVRLAGPSLP